MGRWLYQVGNILYIREIILLDEEIFTRFFCLQSINTEPAG